MNLKSSQGTIETVPTSFTLTNFLYPHIFYYPDVSYSFPVQTPSPEFLIPFPARLLSSMTSFSYIFHLSFFLSTIVAPKSTNTNEASEKTPSNYLSIAYPPHFHISACSTINFLQMESVPFIHCTSHYNPDFYPQQSNEMISTNYQAAQTTNFLIFHSLSLPFKVHRNYI